MASTIMKPQWWKSLSAAYTIINDEGTLAIDPNTITTMLNDLFAPAPLLYKNYMISVQGVTSGTTNRLDIISLTSGHDFSIAQSGNDFVNGYAGDDVLFGDAGTDILHGGAGSDLIIGGDGADPESSNRNDIVSYLDAPSGISVVLNSGVGYVSNDGYGSSDWLYGVGNIIGSDHDDTIESFDVLANTLIGGLGNDTITAGSGNDIIVGGSGTNILRGNFGDDTFIIGNGENTIYTGAGQDRVVVTSILNNSNSASILIQDFHAGIGGDKVDVSAILRTIGYHGSDAVADGYIKLIADGSGMKIALDVDGTGPESSQDLVTIKDVSLLDFSASSNLVMNAKTILFAPVLGQSNASGLSIEGGDGESGISHLKNTLSPLTDYDEIVSVLKDPYTADTLDIAVGGSTVDGNTNSGYAKNLVWWYPDQAKPGDVCLRAVDMLATQLANLRAQGNVTPVIIWGQGEAETRWLGAAIDPDAAMARYMNATLSVFNYIKSQLGDDIQFYIMQTGRYNPDAALNEGTSQATIDTILRGLDLVYSAQQRMALERPDIHLAVDYSDLRMLHESDPVGKPQDTWHIDYDDREIIGNRLGDFISADLGYTHVIRNIGDYPLNTLSDIAIIANSQGVTVTGTQDSDLITGTGSNDTLNGMEGEDILIGGIGNDLLSGGFGDDIYYFEQGQGIDIIDDAGGLADKIYFHGVLFSQLSFSQTGDDLVIDVGSSGNDKIIIQNSYTSGTERHIESLIFEGGSSFDLLSLMNFPPDAKDDSFTIEGGTLLSGNVLQDNGHGIDSDLNNHVLSVMESSILTEQGRIVTFSAQGDFVYASHEDFIGTDTFTYTVTDGHGGTDTGFVSITVAAPPNSIIGTSGDDFSILGTESNDTIYGLAGNDVIKSGSGDDLLYGGAGQDRLEGADGADTLFGGEDNDTLRGGNDADLLTGGMGNDDVRGGYGNDTAYGNDGNDRVEGDEGNDTLYGGNGIDSLRGNSGNDILFGDDGSDDARGGDGDDIVYGGSSLDILYGDAGNDLLYGGSGTDKLVGGDGADGFAFDVSTLSGRDNIRDFNAGNGDYLFLDHLLTGYDPLTSVITDFIRITDNGINSYLSVDTDGTSDIASFVQIARIDNALGLTDEAQLLIDHTLRIA